jgi:hypothetical protein
MDLDQHKAFLEALYAAAGAVRDNQADALASNAGVTIAEARAAIQAATEILEWRLDYTPPQRVFWLARAMIEPERKRPTQAEEFSSERRG